METGEIEVTSLSLEEIKLIVKRCLKKVYKERPSLIEKYDICERSIMYRFAFYLQKKFPNYFVDCEFDKKTDQSGEVSQKDITKIKNYVDIIIHHRGHGRDFLCFELKKMGRSNGVEGDREELKILTSCEPESFQYRYGFLIILNKKFEDVVYEIYEKGELIE